MDKNQDDQVQVNRRFFILGAGVVSALGSSAALNSVANAQPAIDFAQPAESLTLTIDGEQLVIPAPDAQAYQLTERLQNPSAFEEFARNPADYLRYQHGIEIDPRLAEVLRERIGNATSLQELHSNIGNCETCATVWAVASGSYSVASSKIAVAW